MILLLRLASIFLLFKSNFGRARRSPAPLVQDAALDQGAKGGEELAHVAIVDAEIQV